MLCNSYRHHDLNLLNSIIHNKRIQDTKTLLMKITKLDNFPLIQHMSLYSPMCTNRTMRSFDHHSAPNNHLPPYPCPKGGHISPRWRWVLSSSVRNYNKKTVTKEMTESTKVQGKGEWHDQNGKTEGTCIGKLTSTMAPAASVRVGEISSKSRLKQSQ